MVRVRCQGTIPALVPYVAIDTNMDRNVFSQTKGGLVIREKSNSGKQNILGKDNTYQEKGKKVNPCNGREIWPVVESRKVIIPPWYKPYVGRPPKKRNKSHVEIISLSASSGKLSRKGKSIKCGKCGNVGHNRKGCRGQGGANQAGGSSQAGVRKVFGQAAGARKASHQFGGSSQPSAAQSTTTGARSSSSQAVSASQPSVAPSTANQGPTQHSAGPRQGFQAPRAAPTSGSQIKT
ncbi:hypothetical protein Tco_0233220 [Tanacetum coccineum]